MVEGKCSSSPSPSPLVLRTSESRLLLITFARVVDGVDSCVAFVRDKDGAFSVG